MYTHLSIDGVELWVVCGILGEDAEQIYNTAKKLTAAVIRDIKSNGIKMFRMFDTEQEAQAYIIGLGDAEDWFGYCFTSVQDNQKIFGKLKQQIKIIEVK